MAVVDIAKAFATAAGNVAGIRGALHYQPEALPPLPAVTMLHRRFAQTENQTGPATQNDWTWAVYLTLPLGGRVAGSDFEAAQELLYTLLPALLAIPRSDPELGGTCIKAWLADLGEEPDFDEDDKTFVKILELTARTEEV